MEKFFIPYIERKGTDSKKWDIKSMFEMAEYADGESIPLWIADMDFKTLNTATEELEKRVKEGVFGYNTVDDEYYKKIKFWLKKKKDLDIEEEWVVPTPSVLMGISLCVRGYTKEGDGIIVQNPVYPPFRNAINLNDRVVINNPLKYINGYYEMDFVDLEEKLKLDNTKMMILCSPHNPVGRVWREDELKKVYSLCKKYNVLLVSDEIHSDLILFGNKFISMGKIAENLDNLIICTSITKTFNLAALKVSNMIIPNRELRDIYVKELLKVGQKPVPNIFGAVALKAVYTQEGEQWLEALLRYLENNYDYLEKFIKKELPNLNCTKIEGTYLAWIDFNNTLLSPEEIKRKLEEECKIVIDSGEIFGDEGKGFIRFNFACHKSTLVEALNRLKNSFGK